VKRAALALLLLAAVPVQAALPGRLPPVEQCTGDASFTRFRTALRQGVEKKDRDRLLALMAPDVMVDFGGSSGPAEFAKQWSFDAGEYGNVWDQLGTMLRMGCAPQDKARVIPSMTVQLDRFDSDELYDYVLVLPGARLLKELGVEARNPATTPWALVKVTSRSADWGTGVRLRDGREGHITDDHVYEPLGYRMTIEKRGGKWLITAFVAGD
jgi:hypothetical protein